MNIVKKCLCICLAILLIGSLAACGKDKDKSKDKDKGKEITSDVSETTSKKKETTATKETSGKSDDTTDGTTASDTDKETETDTTANDTTVAESTAGSSGGSSSGGSSWGGSSSGGSSWGGSSSGSSSSSGSTSSSGGSGSGAVSVPVGTYSNPASLVIGNNTAYPNGSGSYIFNWTATADTALVLEFSGAAGWSYQVNNLTAGANFTQESNSSGEAVSPAYVTVLYGDSIQIAVNTVSGGAGNVTVKASLLAEWGTVNTPIPITIGQTNYLRVGAGKTLYFTGRPYNTTMVLNGAANSTLSFNGSSHQFTGGTFSVQMPKSEGGSAEAICFGLANYNGSTQEYNLTCNFPLGTADNPAAANIGANSVQIEAGSQYGYIYEWTAPAKGRLYISMTGSNWHYEILNINTMGQEQSTSSERPPVSEASVAVRAGQVVRITINSGDGNAAYVTFNLSFS